MEDVEDVVGWTVSSRLEVEGEEWRLGKLEAGT